jgi:Fic family protein
VPPFDVTPRVLDALSRIDHSLGRLEGLAISQPQPLLRKRNRVRTVHASAAIEGNRLAVEQVTAVLEGQRVLGRAQDVREIVNVNEAYERLPRWRASSRRSLLEAHATLMRGLIPEAGAFRRSGVGVFRGDKLTHLAPPAHLVTHHVDALLRWVARPSTSILVAGCVVHYELLFIHPFTDGNGRLARLWQQVVHRAHSPLLQFVPVESVVRDRQRQYDAALRRSDREGRCTRFLEFSLDALAQALTDFGDEVRGSPETPESRLERARQHFGRRWFSRSAYLGLHPRLSTATASRDLARGVAVGRLSVRGARRLTEYRCR